MRVNYLLSNELDWELLIREVDPKNRTVDEKRKLLRTKLNIETVNPKLSYPRVCFDSSIELEVCEEKLDDLNSILEKFEGKPLTAVYNRLKTRFLHVLRRLNYLEDNDIVPERVDTLKSRCLKLLNELEEVGDSEEMYENDLASVLERSRLGGENVSEVDSPVIKLANNVSVPITSAISTVFIPETMSNIVTSGFTDNNPIFVSTCVPSVSFSLPGETITHSSPSIASSNILQGNSSTHYHKSSGNVGVRSHPNDNRGV